MGLDIWFFDSEREEPVFYIRNHHYLFSKILSTSLALENEDCSDFWIYDFQIAEIKEEAGDQYGKPQSETGAMSDHDILKLSSCGEEELTQAQRDQLYPLVLQKLYDLARQEGGLLCSWSN